MAQIAWGYVEIGSQLVRAYVRDDGAVCTTLGSVVDDIDVDGALWKTRRSVDAILGETEIRASRSVIALVGPNGGMTDAARAISARTDARNTGVYTTEELIAKFGGKISIDVVRSFYSESEVETVAA
jgi:hypothetical protein